MVESTYVSCWKCDLFQLPNPQLSAQTQGFRAQLGAHLRRFRCRSYWLHHLDVDDNIDSFWYFVIFVIFCYMRLSINRRTPLIVPSKFSSGFPAWGMAACRRRIRCRRRRPPAACVLFRTVLRSALKVFGVSDIGDVATPNKKDVLYHYNENTNDNNNRNNNNSI